MSHITITLHEYDGNGHETDSRPVVDADVSERDLTPTAAFGYGDCWPDCRCPVHRPDLHSSEDAPPFTL